MRLLTITLISFAAFVTITSCGQQKKKEQKIVNTIAANVQALKSDTSLKNSLTRKLLGIYEDDQKYRQQFEGNFIKYGINSKEVHALWDQINQMDSVNLIKIKAILDQYGWLGQDLVGQDGNSAIYLVIQHADASTRAKYLPVMRDAVKRNHALASDLATMEDRILLEQHKKQRYGTQMHMDYKTGKYILAPLADPEHVEERRAKVGLSTMAHHLAKFGLSDLVHHEVVKDTVR